MATVTGYQILGTGIIYWESDQVSDQQTGSGVSMWFGNRQEQEEERRLSSFT